VKYYRLGETDRLNKHYVCLTDSSGYRLEVTQTLLEAEAQVNSADNKGRSVLHYAVNNTTGGFETLTDLEDLLLKYGANTTTRDCRGRLPLHYAFVKIGK
jgi:ankyrin repeat protein